MLRRWLFVGLFLAVLYAVSILNTKKRRARYPILKRLDKTITILVWVLLVAYGLSFLYWFYTHVIR
ncbi:MAG: hypothetical protein AB1715_06040 [Acidobacteriota bacterium]